MNLKNEKPDNRNICRINEPPFHQCCCKCVWEVPDFHHCDPETHGKRNSKCFTRKGWACLVFLHEKRGNIFSNHPKHCVGCELFTDKREKKHRSLLRRLFNMWPEKAPQLPRKKSRKPA